MSSAVSAAEGGGLLHSGAGGACGQLMCGLLLMSYGSLFRILTADTTAAVRLLLTQSGFLRICLTTLRVL